MYLAIASLDGYVADEDGNFAFGNGVVHLHYRNVNAQRYGV